MVIISWLYNMKQLGYVTKDHIAMDTRLKMALFFNSFVVQLFLYY